MLRVLRPATIIEADRRVLENYFHFGEDVHYSDFWKEAILSANDYDLRGKQRFQRFEDRFLSVSGCCLVEAHSSNERTPAGWCWETGKGTNQTKGPIGSFWVGNMPLCLFGIDLCVGGSPMISEPFFGWCCTDFGSNPLAWAFSQYW